MILLKNVIWIVRGEGSIYRPRVSGWMTKMQGEAKAYGELGCHKRDHMDCASLDPIRDGGKDKMNSQKRGLKG